MDVLIFFVLGVIGGFFLGKKHGARAVAELREAKDSLEAQVVAWKEAAESKLEDIKSKF